MFLAAGMLVKGFSSDACLRSGVGMDDIKAAMRLRAEDAILPEPCVTFSAGLWGSRTASVSLTANPHRNCVHFPPAVTALSLKFPSVTRDDMRFDSIAHR